MERIWADDIYLSGIIVLARVRPEDKREWIAFICLISI